ncbi:MAG: DUF1501 domain-containing protein [Planctomycetes bacterium]|nr:DUF1501 domain-containing protein [Planctomycetota bacterium]
MESLRSGLGAIGRPHALDRRGFLQLAGLGGLSWLTPVSHLLARAAEASKGREPAQSIILLWLAGGPSQLETFDPHPGTMIAGGTQAIATAVPGVQLARGFEGLAERLKDVALVRSMVSKEADHARGTYLVKTGYRPDPTIVHPSIGAICCHELPAGKTEIPRHISILPGQWPSRGGFLGEAYDAFKMGDPAEKVPDITPQVSPERDRERVRDLDVVQKAFFQGRRTRSSSIMTAATISSARTMMSSAQLKAFEVLEEPRELRLAYGDTPFGRGCLAARRLLQVGVRCVEVSLTGWDSHADNHNIHRKQLAILDPALSTLLRDLKEHGLLEKTVVFCAGEFGRTPRINPLAGRDHWPNGFSLALAGGGIHGGQVIGQTDPEGIQDPVNPVSVADVHATILTAVGIDPTKIMTSPIGRTITLSDGKPIQALLG